VGNEYGGDSSGYAGQAGYACCTGGMPGLAESDRFMLPFFVTSIQFSDMNNKEENQTPLSLRRTT
jgi:hypothetical protein